MRIRNRSTSVFLGIALATLMAGCEAPTGNQLSELKTDTGSGIQGRVTLGPICPVQSWLNDCPDHPMQATLSVRDAEGNEMAQLESDADGFYSITLDSGSYVLVAQPVTDKSANPPTEFLRWPAPPAAVAVAVVENLWTTVNLSYDTGIR